jgi:uncharacterized phage protein gp47/JayE
MDYTRPTYAQLNARIAADLAAMPAVLREPLSAAWARLCHGMHGHFDWVVLQTSPLTCELERLYDWAELYAVPRLLATAASGSVTVTGTVGATLLAGTTARGSNGLDYQTLAAVTVGVGGTATVDVRCVSTGAASNLTAGQLLTITSAVAGISSTLTATAGLTGGAEDEVVDDWRARVADEWTALVTDGARGGKYADYVYWAKSAHPSVTGALVQLHTLGIGTVVIRPICDELAGRMPTATVLAEVVAYLANASPMVDVSVMSPTAKSVTVSIDLVASVDTAANRASIAEAVGALVFSKESAGATITPAEIDDAVSSVTAQYTRIAPTANTTCGAGEVFVLQPIVWV